jgi:NAD(P)-dependent dehydrogenase (short-subunit alcohol dehydrogenase family)
LAVAMSWRLAFVDGCFLSASICDVVSAMSRWFWDEMSGPNAAGYRHMIDTSAAGRMGTPSDVADAAALLLGPEGSFITGSDLLIDGGVIAARFAAANATAPEPAP